MSSQNSPPLEPAFPQLKSKLSLPTKKSAFEKAKADAEAKRLREEAETAAVYQDFVKSFADEDEVDDYDVGGRGGALSRGGGSLRGKAPAAGAGRRHFTTSGRGAPPPPPPSQSRFGRKRAFDEEGEEREGRRRVRDSSGAGGLLAFENSGAASQGQKEGKEEYFSTQHSDDEDEEREKDQPKPTLQLKDLPPDMSAKEIRDVFAGVNRDMVIEAVRLVPTTTPSGPGGQGAVRKAMTAIVTLALGTPASEIDAATSTLQNRYLGRGYWLSLSRHLPSTIIGQDMLLGSSNSSHPFGAKAPSQPINRLNRAPPPGGFAPPSQFGGRQQSGPAFTGRLEVPVATPKDLKQLKLIHKTIESVLTHGPEFEALLMAREDIQQDERWSWLWDTRSPAHNYYLWRLWDIFSGTSALDSNHPSLRAGNPVDLFAGQQLPTWIPPRKRLHYEFATSLGDITADPDYRSEDEFASDSEAEGPDGEKPTGGLGIGGDEKKRSYLTPFDRAKLIHLIARVPTSTTKVRRGDIARVMAFAVEHAWAAEEVVDVLVANIIRPFALQKSLDNDSPYAPSSSEDEDAAQKADDKERDTSGAKIVGLYLVSDVLSNSSLGVRNVWRYRTHVETKLRETRVMEELGRVPEREGWGRIRKEKFKRLVSGVLSLWESWCIFPQTSHEALLQAFLDPPSDKPTQSTSSSTSSSQPTPAATSTPASAPAPAPQKSKWRTVETTAAPAAPAAYNPFAPPQTDHLTEPNIAPHSTFTQPETQDSFDGAPMSDVEEDYDVYEGENLDGVPMTPSSDEGGDEGIAMEEDTVEGQTPAEEKKEEKKEEEKPKISVGGFGLGLGFNMSLKKAEKRKRPKAEDMFAGEDDD